MLYQSTITRPIAIVMLFGCMTISACSPAKQDEQSKQMPSEKTSASDQPIHKEVGNASWYGPGLNGQETANGETFDQSKLTAAHPTLPMGTKAKVTNLENGKKVEVKINDRGPFVGNRVLDVSEGAAKKLDMKEDGTTQVKIETVKKKAADVQPDKTK